MTFVPPSSIPSGSVTIVGAVDVSDRAGRLLGHVTVDNASLPVTGPQTDAEFAARLPFAVTGPLTDAELAARLPLAIAGAVTQGTSPWVVDGSGVTQPVSVDELPLPDGAATDERLGDLLAAERGSSDALGLVANALTDVDPTSLGDE